MTRTFRGYWLGRRPYLPVHDLMNELFEARKAGSIGDTILFVEHEPVITRGRGAKAPHLLASEAQLNAAGVDLVTTGRGGDVTLHGPGQLVAYPIIDLAPDRCDVRRYVKDLAEVMRLLVAHYGVAAGPFEKYVGLWVDAAEPNRWQGAEHATSPAKVGAIGVRISRWVTMHGFALNLDIDLSWFQLIVPCGISEYPVASVKTLTGSAPSIESAAQRAFALFCQVFAAVAEGDLSSWPDSAAHGASMRSTNGCWTSSSS